MVDDNAHKSRMLTANQHVSEFIAAVGTDHEDTREKTLLAFINGLAPGNEKKALELMGALRAVAGAPHQAARAESLMGFIEPLSQAFRKPDPRSAG